MAKYRFYVDLWPGLNPQQYGLTATTRPGSKTTGTRRVAFDVAIPDEILFQVDAHSPEVSRPELVASNDDV